MESRAKVPLRSVIAAIAAAGLLLGGVGAATPAQAMSSSGSSCGLLCQLFGGGSSDGSSDPVADPTPTSRATSPKTSPSTTRTTTTRTSAKPTTAPTRSSSTSKGIGVVGPGDLVDTHFLEELTLEEFYEQGLIDNPGKASIGFPAMPVLYTTATHDTIEIALRNQGKAKDTFEVVLRAGQYSQTKKVTLKGGEKAAVEFVIRGGTIPAGTADVTVTATSANGTKSEQSQKFTVLAPTESEAQKAVEELESHASLTDFDRANIRVLRTVRDPQTSTVVTTAPPVTVTDTPAPTTVTQPAETVVQTSVVADPTPTSRATTPKTPPSTTRTTTTRTSAKPTTAPTRSSSTTTKATPRPSTSASSRATTYMQLVSSKLGETSLGALKDPEHDSELSLEEMYNLGLVDMPGTVDIDFEGPGYIIGTADDETLKIAVRNSDKGEDTFAVKVASGSYLSEQEVTLAGYEKRVLEFAVPRKAIDAGNASVKVTVTGTNGKITEKEGNYSVLEPTEEEARDAVERLIREGASDEASRSLLGKLLKVSNDVIPVTETVVTTAPPVTVTNIPAPTTITQPTETVRETVRETSRETATTEEPGESGSTESNGTVIAVVVSVLVTAFALLGGIGFAVYNNLIPGVDATKLFGR